MSTRANYVFYNGRAKIGNIYIHHDGYPEGAATYFHKAMIQDGGRVTLNGFYKANADKAEWAIENHGDIEYLYKINTKTQTITMYHEGIISMPKESGIKIPEFINKYFEVFSDNKVYRKYISENISSFHTQTEFQERTKAEATWIKAPIYDIYGMANPQWTCLELLYKELQEMQSEFINKAYFYGMKNPNTINLTRAITDRFVTIQALLARRDHDENK